MLEEVSRIFSFLVSMSFPSFLTIKIKVNNTKIIKNGKYCYKGGRGRV